MTSYFLFDSNKTLAFNGSQPQCIALGTQLARQGICEVVKIARARPGERDATIIAEITVEGLKATQSSRHVSSKKLLALVRRSPLED